MLNPKMEVWKMILFNRVILTLEFMKYNYGKSVRLGADAVRIEILTIRL